jgi:CRP/FNR family cyclic AMP-dependent transcriptional regulator
MTFFDEAYAAAARPVRLLDADPDLLGDAGPAHPLANVQLDLIRLQMGARMGPRPSSPPSLGLLVLDGLLARRVSIHGQQRAELVGAGDLVRPWDTGAELTSLALAVQWHVMAPARLAVLDARFVSRCARSPDVLARLAVRGVQRSHRLATQLAIADIRHVDDRLLSLFKFFGDRFGRMTPRGVHLPVPMTHDLLAELVGAKRPTVTTALGELERRGALHRLDDRTWLIRPAADDRGDAVALRGSPSAAIR